MSKNPHLVYTTYKGEYITTILASDVNFWNLPKARRVLLWRVHGVLGRIMPCDIGKQVWMLGNVLMVESHEQMTARLAKQSK